MVSDAVVLPVEETSNIVWETEGAGGGWENVALELPIESVFHYLYIHIVTQCAKGRMPNIYLLCQTNI